MDFEELTIICAILACFLVVSVIGNLCQCWHTHRNRRGIVRPAGYKRDVALLGGSSGEINKFNSSTTTFIVSSSVSRQPSVELARSGVSIVLAPIEYSSNSSEIEDPFTADP